MMWNPKKNSLSHVLFIITKRSKIFEACTLGVTREPQCEPQQGKRGRML